jgi:hypothetical protein
MWRLNSGEIVVDRPNSHLHDGVWSLLPEALGKIDSERKAFIEEEIRFGRVVGNTACVTTTDGDDIVFAQRPRRAGLTRFVKGRIPEPCSSLVVVLKKSGDVYVLITAFIGHKSEPEPWDERTFSFKDDPSDVRGRAIAFWATHALVWGVEPVVAGTETETFTVHGGPDRKAA